MQITIAEISWFWPVFVASDLIEKLYIGVEFEIRLKLYINWHHVETVIETFEQKYGFSSVFLQNTELR